MRYERPLEAQPQPQIFVTRSTDQGLETQVLYDLWFSSFFYRCEDWNTPVHSEQHSAGFSAHIPLYGAPGRCPPGHAPKFYLAPPTFVNLKKKRKFAHFPEA